MGSNRIRRFRNGLHSTRYTFIHLHNVHCLKFYRSAISLRQTWTFEQRDYEIIPFYRIFRIIRENRNWTLVTGYPYPLPFTFPLQRNVFQQSHNKVRTIKTKWFRQIKLYNSDFGGKDVDGRRFQSCHKKEKGRWVRLSNYQLSKERPQDLLMPRVSCKVFYKQITINKCNRRRPWSGWIKRWIENTNRHPQGNTSCVQYEDV